MRSPTDEELVGMPLNFKQALLNIPSWPRELRADAKIALRACWHAVNNAQLTVIADSHPVSKSIPNSLQFSVPSGSSGDVGFTNEGFWGNRLFFMYYLATGT